MTEVRFRDRRSGEILCETHAIEDQIRQLYHTPWGRLVLELVVSRKLASWYFGVKMGSPPSRDLIQPFIRQHHLDPGEFLDPVDNFTCFDDFFTRRLKPEARPFDPDPHVLASPADGKILVFPELKEGTRLPVKGALLPIERLLGMPAEEFRGGAVLVIRLAPHDYHRYHFPDSGEAGPAREIHGCYHSVSPIALERVPDAFLRNKRTVTLFDSDHFGRIAYVEVGALTVGTIIQTYAAGRVERGQEKGYFRFGGSTLVLVFEPQRVTFDSDLVQDSHSGLEVQVLAGSGIGRSIHGIPR